MIKRLLVILLAVLLLITGLFAQKPLSKLIKPVNQHELPQNTKIIAIVRVNLIDGRGGKAIPNASVLIRNNKIIAVGTSGSVQIPKEAEIIQGNGMSLLPGLIDSHFHLDRTKDLPAMFLQNGITSLRDPGAWIEAYAEERKSGKQMPRLYLSGPHLDGAPPAYPYDAYVVRDENEAIRQVNELANEGSTVIKVYFRIPPGMIKAITETAHRRGIPVTAHLEITEAKQAIEAGLDGVEHITSLGLSLTPKREAEKYRQGMLADNNFRKQGRYNTWATLDLNSPLADSLTTFLVKKKTFISPTLGAFEYQAEKNKTDSIKLRGFESMKKLTFKLHKAGVLLVMGSHSMIAYAEKGWAYQREMEIWAESGISNSEIIHASTLQNARFFRIDQELGSIEKGKIADLILVKGNPLEDIRVMRNVEKVMINGVFVK
ncbi:MAG: amidohydrolase family protein [Pedobacter sp.]|jgi:imidazolonepropionase-like amidohydrolase